MEPWSRERLMETLLVCDSSWDPVNDHCGVGAVISVNLPKGSSSSSEAVSSSLHLFPVHSLFVLCTFLTESAAQRLCP